MRVPACPLLWRAILSCMEVSLTTVAIHGTVAGVFSTCRCPVAGQCLVILAARQRLRSAPWQLLRCGLGAVLPPGTDSSRSQCGCMLHASCPSVFVFLETFIEGPCTCGGGCARTCVFLPLQCMCDARLCEA